VNLIFQLVLILWYLCQGICTVCVCSWCLCV